MDTNLFPNSIFSLPAIPSFSTQPHHNSGGLAGLPALRDPRPPGSESEADCGLSPFCFPSHQPLFALIFLYRNSLAGALRRLALKRDLPRHPPLRGRGLVPGGSAPTEAARMHGRPRAPSRPFRRSPCLSRPSRPRQREQPGSAPLTSRRERNENHFIVLKTGRGAPASPPAAQHGLRETMGRRRRGRSGAGQTPRVCQRGRGCGEVRAPTRVGPRAEQLCGVLCIAGWGTRSRPQPRYPVLGPRSSPRSRSAIPAAALTKTTRRVRRGAAPLAPCQRGRAGTHCAGRAVTPGARLRDPGEP